MKAFLDTNIFIYATYPSFKQFNKATAFLKDCTQGPDLFFLSWGVIYEYLCVVTNRKLFTKETLSFQDALDNILNFKKSAYVDMLVETVDHPIQLNELNHESQMIQGAIIHDAHHVVLMREHEVKRIYTADTDFNRFKNIEVVNPFF